MFAERPVYLSSLGYGRKERTRPGLKAASGLTAGRTGAPVSGTIIPNKIYKGRVFNSQIPCITSRACNATKGATDDEYCRYDNLR